MSSNSKKTVTRRKNKLRGGGTKRKRKARQGNTPAFSIHPEKS